METLSGYIEQIIFQNEENGYCVFAYRCEDEVPEDAVDEEGLMTCVGNLPGVSPGEYIRLTGDYVVHKSYGLQFAVRRFEASLPADADAIKKYLASGAVKGIGAVLAKRIVKKFGNDTFRIMESEPERLAEVSGISTKKAMEISDQVLERRDQREAMLLLGAYDIGQTVALRAYRLYGSRLKEVLDENPYRLAEEVDGIGFETADRIAVQNGFALDSDFRISCGMLYVLSRMSGMGHTYLPNRELAEHVSSLLKVEEGDVLRLLPELVIDKKIITKKDQVYLPAYYKAEAGIAKSLVSLDEEYEVDGGHIDGVIARLLKDEGRERDEVQRRAVFEAAGRGVLVLTGGPGTGKTSTIRMILRYFEEEGLEIMLCAPTGRAAKRMSEATGRPAQTIHRMLGLGGGEEEGGREEHSRLKSGFSYNAGHPLECDVVIVDEVSMVDVLLLYALVKAVAVGTRLILVGDVNQLPSVGPGNVLKDIIYSGAFSVVTLERIFRQSHQSDIVENAHSIIRGEHVVMDNQRSSDFFMAKSLNAEVIVGKICEWLQKDRLPAYVGAKSYEVQVLTPMRKGALGVERLNLVLQRHLNPAAVNKPEYEYGGRVFREGDKVMQIKNDYELEWKIYGKSRVVIDSGEGVFNGDTGMITSMDTLAKTLTVTFDDERVAEYEFSRLNELDLAYAVTIHKSQGSEYPAIILPLLRGPQKLYNRNLLYTAVTRAKKCVLIIGDEETFQNMIDNTMENKRYSGLKDRIMELLQLPQETILP